MVAARSAAHGLQPPRPANARLALTGAYWLSGGGADIRRAAQDSVRRLAAIRVGG